MREQTDDPKRCKAYCLLCLQSGRQQALFMHAKGTGTSTFNQHLDNIYGITKATHESGEARGGTQQTQIGGFMSSSPSGGIPFSYNRD